MIYLYGLIVFIKRIKYSCVLIFQADSNIQGLSSDARVFAVLMSVFLSQHPKFQWVLVMVPVFGLAAT
jgi:hypothetical protein